MDNTRTCEPSQDQIRTFSAKGQEVDMHQLQTFEQNGAASPQISPSPSSFEELLPTRPLKSESEFYQEYSWSLNVFPTFREIVRYLARDLQRFEQVELDWRRSEAWTNVHLLAGSITNTLDDYLLGDHYDLSRAAGMVPFLRLGFRAAEEILNMPSRLRTKRLSSLLAWREKWTAAVDEFLFQSFADGELSPRVSSETKQRSLGLLSATFPRNLLDQRPRIPAYFRSRDFTHFDGLLLAQKFLNTYPERERPVLIAGLRTAGSFLGPLICAFLRNQGYRDVDWVTFRPRKAISSSERIKLQQAFSKDARVAIVDEPVLSGSTLAKTVSILRGMGFSHSDLVALLPVDPAFQQWKDSFYIQALSRVGFLPLEPQERYKQRLLESAKIENLFNEYFRNLGYESARIASSPIAEAFNRDWWSRPPEKADCRLKRVFQVELTGPRGPEIRYVLAKSVGWGWMGYHAFLAGQRLAGFVSPVLGQRDGILYTEWIPQNGADTLSDLDRGTLVNALSSYVVSRARTLKLESDLSSHLGGRGGNKTFEHLARVLSKAYNSRIAAALRRPGIEQELAQQSCSVPNLTDSQMALREWIRAGSRLLKTDFEHHCQGKNETCATDSAYDLADAILQLGLSEDESIQLIERYTQGTGDRLLGRRLYFNKLAAGTWSQMRALNGLRDPRQLHRQKDYHKQYLAAWNYLVTETVRECGKLCQQRNEIRWQDPIIVLDIDGVLDRMVFSFPSATAAGIRALSLFHAHGFAMALDTARTLREVKEYCRAYGLVGGAAEYGSVVWNAVNGRTLPLVGRESLEQLKRVRDALQTIPGVFLNQDYEFSLRAFTYESDRTRPLPPLLAESLIARLHADRLKIHHTGSDTAILAKEVDKGVGLLELLGLVGMSDAKVLAIGDSEPDLSMFRVANGSFAPSQITCANIAQAFGCQIVDRPGPLGLLGIARKIAHPNGGTCNRCQAVDQAWPKEKDLFVRLLEVADQKRLPLLLRSLLESSALLSLLKK